MQFFKPKSFFYKTLSVIALVSIGFQIILFSVFAYYMLIPLGQRATDDLSSVIIHAAERWEDLNAEQQIVFSKQMFDKHNLVITNQQPSINPTTSILPYISLLENSLHTQSGKAIVIKENIDKSGERWFWADMPMQDNSVRVGFSRSRIGINPPVAFFIILVVGILLVLSTSIYLTKRLSNPIDSLYKASQSLGKGNWPRPIKEQGPTELAVLAKQFNKMSLQVQELLSNRTVLLSGIAHDLRTPLTQINLALTMLPNDGGDTKLMNSIEQDLNNIDHLISEALSIGAELTSKEENPSNITNELQNIVNGVSATSNINIKEVYCGNCIPILYPLAFKRIITNLLTNAIRYGNNKPITIILECSDKLTTIQIKDRGNGIPDEFNEKVFQPFYRLEKSRNSATGGSGLGLAIARQLAHSHNWEINLTPRKNGGTNATLLINT